MAGNTTIQPFVTTGFSGAFQVETKGWMQGIFLDDPAVRYQLEGGTVAASQTLWGGVPISLAVAGVNDIESGEAISSAGSLVAIDGWLVFNQATAGIITPNSNVPLYTAGTSANFFRAGSNARICVPIANTTILNALVGAAPTVDLYWDPTNLNITTTSSGNYGPLPVALERLSNGSKTVDYNSGSGVANWSYGQPAAIIRI